MKAHEVLLGDQAEAGELIARLMRGYRTSDADGLFLIEVTHDGIRLTVSRLVSSLSAFRAPQFVDVYAAADLGHTPLDLETAPGDVYLARCHTWVGRQLGAPVQQGPRNGVRPPGATPSRPGSATDPALSSMARPAVLTGPTRAGPAAPCSRIIPRPPTLTSSW